VNEALGMSDAALQRQESPHRGSATEKHGKLGVRF
jgi:hypothetical protein